MRLARLQTSSQPSSEMVQEGDYHGHGKGSLSTVCDNRQGGVSHGLRARGRLPLYTGFATWEQNPLAECLFPSPPKATHTCPQWRLLPSGMQSTTQLVWDKDGGEEGSRRHQTWLGQCVSQREGPTRGPKPRVQLWETHPTSL